MEIRTSNDGTKRIFIWKIWTALQKDVIAMNFSWFWDPWNHWCHGYHWYHPELSSNSGNKYKCGNIKMWQKVWTNSISLFSVSIFEKWYFLWYDCSVKIGQCMCVCLWRKKRFLTSYIAKTAAEKDPKRYAKNVF